MSKYTKSLLTILLLPLVISASGCNKKTSKETKANIELNYQETRKSVDFSYVFDLEDFINITDEPNKNVLKMSMLFDANISTGARVNFVNDKYVTPDFTNEDNFYQFLNLDDLEKKDVAAPSDSDIDDISRINLAHKKYNEYDICFVTIVDSGLGKSWVSNFDVGYDDESYYSKTGQHPEWTNKENHKGFDIAGNRIVKLVKDYKKRVLDQNSQQIYYIFGHSRGGALSNIVGAKLTDLDFNTVSYGLASPAITTSSSASSDKYKHLYSYICKEDMVTNILKPDWGFTRYGITKSFSILDYLIEFKEVNGYDFPSSDNLDLAALINSICNGREEIYQISDAFTVVSSDSVYKDNVQEYIDSNLSPLTGKYEVLRNFVECEQTPNEDDTVKIKIKTCPGFLITLFGIIISEVKENTSTGSILFELIGLMKYLNCFMNIMGISITDFRNINTDYFLVCHSYPSYLTYINSL